jgi:hypothetical protein
VTKTTTPGALANTGVPVSVGKATTVATSAIALGVGALAAGSIYKKHRDASELLETDLD